MSNLEMETKSIVRRETQKRTCVKSIGWRIIATITTILISLIYIGDLSMAFKIGIIDSLLKFVFYYLYERGFSKIRWGIEEVEV